MSLFGLLMDRLRRATAHGLTVPELFARYAATRDEPAFAELVARTTPQVRGRCRAYLRDPHEVDEAVQEVFRLLVEKADTIPDPDAVGAWLGRTAVNVARNASRRRARRTATPVAPADLAALAPDPGLSPDERAELREKYTHVLAEIDRLHEDWKRALTLRLVEDRPYSEVAELLGASLDKVRQDVSRARKELRARLARKGIVLPAALAGVLLGQTARGRAPLYLAGGLAAIAVVVAVTRPPTDRAGRAPAPVVPAPAPAAPTPDDLALENVLPLLNKVAGGKARRTEAEAAGPNAVRWRFAWSAGPGAPLRYPSLVNERSYMDLTFDRWSGVLRIALASDGKTAKLVDASRPMSLILFGRDVVIRFPELYELRPAFDPMLLTDVPALGPAPAKAERIAYTRLADDRILHHRPAPEQGVFFRLQPGQTIRIAYRPIGAFAEVIEVWGTWQVDALHAVSTAAGPWEYRNATADPQTLFVVGVTGRTKWPMTCQVRDRPGPDGTRLLEFDEDYAGRFGAFAAEITVRPAN